MEKVKTSTFPDEKKIAYKKCIVAFSLILNLAILFFFKYFNFAGYLFSQALRLFNIRFYFPTLDLLLPVGISFYTFQAMGYAIDVYRGEIYAEKNPFRYAVALRLYAI